ncbi:MAG TPA: hypothetical protein VFV38_17130 [Ktedonobacteraceae bacterium]|nr:hypothetical protein [Ktedonobacteraceae bacterium]
MKLGRTVGVHSRLAHAHGGAPCQGRPHEQNERPHQHHHRESRPVLIRHPIDVEKQDIEHPIPHQTTQDRKPPEQVHQSSPAATDDGMAASHAQKSDTTVGIAHTQKEQNVGKKAIREASHTLREAVSRCVAWMRMD